MIDQIRKRKLRGLRFFEIIPAKRGFKNKHLFSKRKGKDWKGSETEENRSEAQDVSINKT